MNNLSEHTDKYCSINNLSNKLRSNTIRYSEMKLIAEALNMELVFKDKSLFKGQKIAKI